MNELIGKLKDGLIVSCYAGADFNEEMAVPETMACVAKSCVAGGAAAIRTNIENVRAIKAAVSVPVIGIKKVYRSGDMITGDFRITPTLKEVEELLSCGADGIAVDGTVRERYDDLTFAKFMEEIRKRWDTLVIADISTVGEGVAAWKAGADMVGTTLSGYTPYSANPVKFGTLPSPSPDYDIIRDLCAAGVRYVVAEGRINSGEKMKRALKAGAHCVVIGTAITEPRKIVKSILMDARSDDNGTL